MKLFLAKRDSLLSSVRQLLCEVDLQYKGRKRKEVFIRNGVKKKIYYWD